MWAGSTPIRRWRHVAAAVLAGVVWPATAYAICTCGYGDGLFTLTTIAIDGNTSDWAPVHADVDNNVCDGPSGGLTDRDAPVQSTGRDLTHFAYTWDASNVYLFTERVGSTSNQQSFVYYADVDNDGYVETGEPVIGVTWRGNNRRVNVYVFSYVAQAAGGDPMVDAGGFGDGYTLPGAFANVPPTGSPNRSGAWGSANGLQMEFFVTWAELGIAPGTPFTFHVASSNAALGASSFAAQVDDNLSGCGGGLGSTAVRAVTIAPDVNLTPLAGQTAYAAHVVTNTGNADDYFDLSAAVSGDFTTTVTFIEDVDASGTLTAGDVVLTDSDGDGDPDTPLLTAGASVDILIGYDVPVGALPGEVAVVTATAASDAKPLANDSAVDTISVAVPPDIVVDKSSAVVSDPYNLTSDPKAIPGAEIEYTIVVTNQGAGAADPDSTVLIDLLAAEVCLRVVDLGVVGSGPVIYADGSPQSTQVLGNSAPLTFGPRTG